jgi:hypothetical protein
MWMEVTGCSGWVEQSKWRVGMIGLMQIGQRWARRFQSMCKEVLQHASGMRHITRREAVLFILLKQLEPI